MTDYPIDEMMEKAEAEMEAKNGRAECHQKFTCAHCGSRQTIEQANQFFDQATCEECGKITKIEKCGFAIIVGKSR